MKLRLYFFSIFIFLFFVSAPAQTDPNNDPNWNWMAETSWKLYHADFPPGTHIQPTSPFYQDGIGAAIYDNKPEDGWVLLRRDFGTPTRQVGMPFLILYNKYQGLIRIIVYLRIGSAYTTGAIRLFGDNTYDQTVALTFLENISWGRNDLNKVKDRNGAATTPRCRVTKEDRF